MQKVKDRYYNGGGKEKASAYYIGNKEVLKENAKNKYRNLSDEEIEIQAKYGRNGQRNMTEDEESRLKESIKYNIELKRNRILIAVLYSITMSEKTLKFGDVEVNKK